MGGGDGSTGTACTGSAPAEPGETGTAVAIGTPGAGAAATGVAATTGTACGGGTGTAVAVGSCDEAARGADGGFAVRLAALVFFLPCFFASI
jgi:hypothetical protein